MKITVRCIKIVLSCCLCGVKSLSFSLLLAEAVRLRTSCLSDPFSVAIFKSYALAFIWLRILWCIYNWTKILTIDCVDLALFTTLDRKVIAFALKQIFLYFYLSLMPEII